MTDHVASRLFPVDWETLPLGGVVSRITQRNNVGNKNVLTISARDGLVNQEQFFNKRVASADLAPYFLLMHGDFAYNKSYSAGYPVGVMRRLDRYSAGVVSPLYICFRPDSGIIDSDYLAHYLQSGLLDEDIALIAKEGARNHGLLNVGVNDFFSIPIQVPSLGEQKYFAEILDTADEVIWSTERLIAKLEQAKQGSLYDLLTCGVDESGCLRNPRCASNEFVETVLGPLPASWSVRPIEALLADVSPAMRSGPFGSALLKSELVEDGIPMLGIDNVEAERFVGEYSRFVSQEKYLELARYAVRPRDLMVTIMGTVGRCCVVPDNIGQALSSKHVWTLTFDSQRYLPELICLQINYCDWVRRHFARDTQGGIMSAIRSETLRTTLLPVPPISEQCRIWNILQTEQIRIDVARDEVAKLYLLKQGLIDDLLTGQVRVGASA